VQHLTSVRNEDDLSRLGNLIEAVELSWFSVNWKNLAGGLDIGLRLRVSRRHCSHF
jgi:hypothetical protein